MMAIDDTALDQAMRLLERDPRIRPGYVGPDEVGEPVRGRMPGAELIDIDDPYAKPTPDDFVVDD